MVIRFFVLQENTTHIFTVSILSLNACKSYQTIAKCINNFNVRIESNRAKNSERLKATKKREIKDEPAADRVNTAYTHSCWYYRIISSFSLSANLINK